MKTNLLNLVFILNFLLVGNFSFAQNAIWAKGYNCNWPDLEIYNIYSTVTDTFGNVYITGAFTGGTVTFGTITLTNMGENDFFIVKYSPEGNVIWAKGGGGTNKDESSSVAVDKLGNVYVCGYTTSSSIKIGGNSFPGHSYGEYAFLLKLDSVGNVVWLQTSGGNGNANASTVTTDVFGNVYMSGFYDGYYNSFGGYSLDGLNNEWRDFLVKFDAMGNVVWAKNEGGDNEFWTLSGIACDNFGNVYITGSYATSTITFGTTTLTNIGIVDVFLVKYNSTGNVVWARGGGGYAIDMGISVATDQYSNVYITGNYRSPIISFGGLSLTTSGSGTDKEDVFLVKYDSLGNEIWARSAGYYVAGNSNAVTTDKFGGVYIAGYFSSPTITFGDKLLTNSDVDDWSIFLVKYNDAGMVDWAESAGCAFGDHDKATSVCTDNKGSVYIAGTCNNYNFPAESITFGTISISNINIFLAKYSSGTSVPTIPTTTITLYPNPTTGAITLGFAKQTDAAAIKVYNMMGREVYQTTNTSQTTTITLPTLPDGMYMLRFLGKDAGENIPFEVRR